jgi:hypothetical protein
VYDRLKRIWQIDNSLFRFCITLVGEPIFFRSRSRIRRNGIDAAHHFTITPLDRNLQLGLSEGRRWAMRQADVNAPEGKGYVIAFAEWLKRYKVDDMDKSDRAKLLQLMEERPAVEEWRASLTTHERLNLNNPTIVWRKWTADTRVKKPRKPTGNVPATEMGRAQRTVEQLQARVDELEQELAARPKIKNDSADDIVDQALQLMEEMTTEQRRRFIAIVEDKAAS